MLLLTGAVAMAPSTPALSFEPVGSPTMPAMDQDGGGSKDCDTTFVLFSGGAEAEWAHLGLEEAQGAVRYGGPSVTAYEFIATGSSDGSPPEEGPYAGAMLVNACGGPPDPVLDLPTEPCGSPVVFQNVDAAFTTGFASLVLVPICDDGGGQEPPPEECTSSTGEFAMASWTSFTLLDYAGPGEPAFIDAYLVESECDDGGGHDDPPPDPCEDRPSPTWGATSQAFTSSAATDTDWESGAAIQVVDLCDWDPPCSEAIAASGASDSNDGLCGVTPPDPECEDRPDAAFAWNPDAFTSHSFSSASWSDPCDDTGTCRVDDDEGATAAADGRSHDSGTSLSLASSPTGSGDTAAPLYFTFETIDSPHECVPCIWYETNPPGVGPDNDCDDVPNDDDNCPDDANPEQEDTDGGGAGDACDNDDDGDGVPDDEDECPNSPNDDDCDGVPNDEDNCPNTPNEGQQNTDTGDADDGGDACDPDDDEDGTDDANDNCPGTSNPDQSDSDGDGYGDACDPENDSDGDGVPDGEDNCPNNSNGGQQDLDNDGTGDACDNDSDNDGVPDDSDNCDYQGNNGQEDTDGDGTGDACDSDTDGDGVPDSSDNCEGTGNPGQEDTDGDGYGDACDSLQDSDGDGIGDSGDNCPGDYNPDQSDLDADGSGDVCDGDQDGDNEPDGSDNCPNDSNAGQQDRDGDGQGDQCDVDDDGDGVNDDEDACPANHNDEDPDCASNPDGDNYGDDDNCPHTYNPGQHDSDNDGVGDACDDSDGDGVYDQEDNCPGTSNPDQGDADGDGTGDACDGDVGGGGRSTSIPTLPGWDDAEVTVTT